MHDCRFTIHSFACRLRFTEADKHGEWRDAGTGGGKTRRGGMRRAGDEAKGDPETKCSPARAFALSPLPSSPLSSPRLRVSSFSHEGLPGNEKACEVRRLQVLILILRSPSN